MRTLMTLTVMTVGLAAVGCRSAITEPLDALGVARGPGLVVVEQGVARSSVVVNDVAEQSADERAAAAEFVRVVRKMTGVELVIDTSPRPGMSPIYIGRAADAVAPGLQAELVHPDPLALMNDRFVIEIGEGRAIIAGARGWATRIGVTQVLEDAGCRWYMAGEFFEVVPKQPSLRLARGRKVHTPEFEMRNFWYLDDVDRAHLKLTRHDEVLNHGHSWENWIGAERKARPELRGLVHGERKGPLEYTHPDVPDIFIKNILAHIEKTGTRTVSLSTDDGPVYSESAESSAWMMKEYANPSMAFPAIADGVLRLFNKVIPEVKAAHPETVFGFLVYGNTVTPPRYETVDPSIAIVGAPLAENPLVPMTSADPRRSFFRKNFETWMKLAQRGYMYDYDPSVVWLGVLSPQVELWRANVPYYKSIGLRGFNMESRFSAMAESGLNILVASRLFWDAEGDVDAILDEFCGTFYGPAAGSVRQWIDVTQKAILTPAAPVWGNEDHNIELVFTQRVMERARSAIRQAETNAADEPWRQRVRVVRLMHDQIEAYLAMKDALDGGDYLAAIDAVDRMRGYREELHAIDPKLADNKRWDMTMDNPPWVMGQRKHMVKWASLTGQAGDESTGTLIAMLPERWRFAFDPGNLGSTNHWELLESLPDEETIDIGQPWDYQGHAEPRTANGWYRTTIRVPAEFAGEAVRLHFSKLFGMKVTVWLDGQLIEHRDLPRYFWFDYNHSNEFDLTEVVTPGAAQTLTVRVFKEFDWGGPYGAVFLYSPKDAGTALEGAE